MSTVEYSPIEPIGVVAETASDTLMIEWSDGRTTKYPIEWMRWQCPCALCRGEMGTPGRLSHVKTLSPDETRLEDVQPIGRYGIMLFWGDGHHDGIFTYNWLREHSHDGDAGAQEQKSEVRDQKSAEPIPPSDF